MLIREIKGETDSSTHLHTKELKRINLFSPPPPPPTTGILSLMGIQTSFLSPVPCVQEGDPCP